MLTACGPRPRTAIFDVIGTLFSVDVVRSPLLEAGTGEGTFETWFAESLREAFALALARGVDR
jgi:hypothetical protein